MEHPLYNLSNDYDLLVDLLEQGHTIPVFWQDEGWLRVLTARHFSYESGKKYFTISTQGSGLVGPHDDVELFKSTCRDFEIYFVAPNKTA